MHQEFRDGFCTSFFFFSLCLINATRFACFKVIFYVLLYRYCCFSIFFFCLKLLLYKIAIAFSTRIILFRFWHPPRVFHSLCVLGNVPLVMCCISNRLIWYFHFIFSLLMMCIYVFIKWCFVGNFLLIIILVRCIVQKCMRLNYLDMHVAFVFRLLPRDRAPSLFKRIRCPSHMF